MQCSLHPSCSAGNILCGTRATWNNGSATRTSVSGPASSSSVRTRDSHTSAQLPYTHPVARSSSGLRVRPSARAAAPSPHSNSAARARPGPSVTLRHKLDAIRRTVRSSPSVATTSIPSRAAAAAHRPIPAPNSTASTRSHDRSSKSDAASSPGGTPPLRPRVSGVGSRASQSVRTSASSHKAKPVAAVAPVSSRRPPAMARPPPAEYLSASLPTGGGKEKATSRSAEAAASSGATRTRALSSDPSSLEHSCALKAPMIGAAACPIASRHLRSTSPSVRRAHAALDRSRGLKAALRAAAPPGAPRPASSRIAICRPAASASPTTSGSVATRPRPILHPDASLATAHRRLVRWRGERCWTPPPTAQPPTTRAAAAATALVS
eukprot:scaffold2616_cov106-Isochrysis_galbana.AAC.7